MKTSSQIKSSNAGAISQMIESIMEVLRVTLTELGGEYSLTCNPYGFTTAWIENDVEVWWDKDGSSPKMSELTELCALYETILMTMEEIETED